MTIITTRLRRGPDIITTGSTGFAIIMIPSKTKTGKMRLRMSIGRKKMKRKVNIGKNMKVNIGAMIHWGNKYTIAESFRNFWIFFFPPVFLFYI